MKNSGKPVIWLFLFLALLYSCRNNILDLSDKRASLSVSLSINKQLYEGTMAGETSARFIDQSSSSVSLSYTAGGENFTAAVTLQQDPQDAGRFTGTATLEDLPVGVDGVVQVQTFNSNSVLIGDAVQELELEEGDNQVTLTLRISPDSPLLTTISPEAYGSVTIPAGESRFIRLGPLNASQEYYLIGTSQDPQISGDNVVTHLVTETGDLLTITEKPGRDEYYFTPPSDDSYVIFSFYNPDSQALPGYLWWDEVPSYSQVTETGRIKLDTFSPNIYADNAYFTIAADRGRFSVGYQGQDRGPEGSFSTTQDGSTWSETLASALADSSVTTLSPNYYGIADVASAEGYLLFGVFYEYSAEPWYYSLNLGIADLVGSNNYSYKHPSPVDYELFGSRPIMNNRLALSSTHAALASVHPSTNDLRIAMAEVSPGSVGTFTSALASNFDIGSADNLQVAALNDTAYILGQSGSVYRYQAGSSSLSLSPVFSITPGSTDDRHLSIYKNKYVVASTTESAVLYIPDTGETITLFDPSDKSEEILDLEAQGFKVEQHFFGAGNFLIAALELEIPSGGVFVYSLSVSDNGGLSWYSYTGTATTTTLDIREAAVDESLNEIYLRTVWHNGEGEVFHVLTFKLQ